MPIMMPRISSIMLNKSRDNGHFYFTFSVRGKALYSFTIRYGVNCRIFIVFVEALYQVDLVPFYS